MGGTLGIIGSGRAGSTVAHLAVRAGWNVVISNSRSPETLVALVTELGDRARAAPSAEAAASADLVLLAVPVAAITSMPRDELVGKVVIDATNYDSARDGVIAEIDDNVLTSSEYVQQHLPGSYVVKAFNNITTQHLTALVRPVGAADRSALPISGNDAAAKAAAGELINAVGYDTVDVGALEESWRFSPNTALYALVYGGQDVPHELDGMALYAWFMNTPGGPVPAQQIEQLAATAVRGPAALVL